MRITPRGAALLALPSLGHAVSLSDMTPRATGLPPMCEAVYTSQIYGCSSQDFQTNQCSSTCISALYGISQAISHACSGQGITGQNLVVAFLAGVGPQQLCHNAGDSSETPGPPTNLPQPPQTHWSPTIGSSTTTAQKATNTGSLLVDTSSTMTATIIPHKTQTSSSSKAPETSSNTAPIAEHTSPTHSPTGGTPTTSAAGDSQTSLNDHSGGGSPFDSPGNMNAASGISLSFGSMILSAAAAMLMALR